MLYLYRIHTNTWARYNEFARFFLPLVVRRWEPEIDRRIAELKAQGAGCPGPGAKGPGIGSFSGNLPRYVPGPAVPSPDRPLMRRK
jgi:hypothetical protein